MSGCVSLTFRYGKEKEKKMFKYRETRMVKVNFPVLLSR